MNETISSLQGDLKAILWAGSIAVIGASTNPNKLGHIITKNILEGGFRGKVFPINPGGESILGLPTFTDIEAIPGNIDLAVFCVPAKYIPGLLAKAKRKGTRGAVVISGGFREVGNEALEKELVESARQHQIRIIGPNCQGINFAPNRMCASWPLIRKSGSLAIISQSGTIAASLAGWAEQDGIGVSGVISLGNQVDLCETDFLQAFGNDDQTQVIAMYIEGVRSGRRFMEVARQVHKPMLVLKSGRTAGGKIAAASHTKSLAGSDEVFDGLCRQLGILRAETTEELYDFARGFALSNIPSGNQCMIITSSGGSGILAVDAGEQRQITFPPLTPELRKALRESAIPQYAVINNPLDLTGSALSDDYLEAMRVIDDFDFADMLLIIFGDPIPGSAEKVGASIKEMKKSVGVCYIGGGALQDEEIKCFTEMGIPVYPTPERAVRMLAALVNRHKSTPSHAEEADVETF